MYKPFLFLLLLSLLATEASAQKRKKNKKKAVAEIALPQFDIAALQRHVAILASDSMEGRRTGTKGEQLAMNYIRQQFLENGLSPMGTNSTFYQTFEIVEGQEFESKSYFKLNGKELQAGTDYFPINGSANGKKSDFLTPSLTSVGTVWMYDLADDMKKNENNPHFDVAGFVDSKIADVEKKGAIGLILYNTAAKADGLSYDAKGKKGLYKIPVLYLTKEIAKKHIKKKTDVYEVEYNLQITDKKRTGTNVIGYINNNAPHTIVIGAHYDHLGYGEDKNSLYTGKELMIHNGADDNASGVAALIELSRFLNKSNLRHKYAKSNYLFIAFSGEELGLYGSKYFTENPTIPLASINYMINMDMVGRLNDSTKAFTIGGYGTSPTWGQLLANGPTADSVTIKLDSSGTGPSDHSSFYRKDIPVLFFFTGTHNDYHKPSDDTEKLNYWGQQKILTTIANLIARTDSLPKLAFTKTREQMSSSSSTRFSVSLGIMPDYTYSGIGVRADGVSEGKLAQKLGIQAGDILIKLGDNDITSVESYMKALSKFKKGDSTKLTTQRKGKTITYDVTF